MVTGAAGFIGSHLAERLLAEECSVIGVDCFTDYYDRALKESNLASLVGRRGFELRAADLASDAIEPLIQDADFVFHQAGQPGVRGSWGASFASYAVNNIGATQRLLESCVTSARLKRFVNASSSSIYGDVKSLPTPEEALPRPVSPYGVTKLAAEHLCRVYANAMAVPTVSLRYFTVYGPRQRPDMAFTRFCHAVLAGKPISINGDGEQTRDFTYVDDIVDANMAAATAPGTAVVAHAYNLGGGTRVSMNEVLEMLFRVAGLRVPVRNVEQQPGDARHTAADTRLAARDLGFEPKVGLEDGLARQLAWATAMRA
ncbi:MAG: NAD-dependent epimerase/dehydratase family protein [Chloroflexota bacterium]